MPALPFSIKIGGEAGQGIKSAGLMLSKFATRSNLNIYNYIEYPSLIRGGHNVMQINISADPVTGPFKKCDFLIALNQETINRHYSELTEGSGILMDEDRKLDTSKVPSSVNLYPVPLSRISREAKGVELLSNTVALGATLGILGGDIKVLLDLVNTEFGQKGAQVAQMNLAAAEIGYEFSKTNFKGRHKEVLKKAEITSRPAQMVVNGNEAAALGAIAGGLEFAAIYPMSPVSPILAVLADNQKKYNFIYKQPEDEISAINMSIGASFAGARAMTATSGGGFCLMTEGYGLAGMTETPLVIVEGMRGGPATGLPTWSEQGDLRMVLHAHQGEFPRIVLAAGDAGEVFELTREAFNLADIYQTPVVVLMDKNICENDQNFEVFDTSGYKIDRGKTVKKASPDYERYRTEADGISPRAYAGSGNFFIANSDEHDEKGYSTDEIEIRNRQMSKRLNKLSTCTRNHMGRPKLYGPENAELTLVSWGSNKGTILQALGKFPNVNYIHLTWLNPLPVDHLTTLLKGSKNLLNIECNSGGQLHGIIKEQAGISIQNNLLKNDGRPFFVEELEESISKVLKGERI